MSKMLTMAKTERGPVLSDPGGCMAPTIQPHRYSMIHFDFDHRQLVNGRRDRADFSFHVNYAGY
jgi:hypothetical protein